MAFLPLLLSDFCQLFCVEVCEVCDYDGKDL